MPVTFNGTGAATGLSTINGLTLPSDSIQSGLVLISAQTITAASSISFNNVFSSNYANYRVVVNANMTANNNLLCRLRASSIDATTLYNEQEFLYGGTTIGGSRSTSGSHWNFVRIDYANLWNNACYDIFSPNLARITSGSGVQARNLNAANVSIMIQNILHDSATQFDGLTFYVGSGTFSGEIRIYGYRN
jgi:hypothetical protein